MRFKRLPNSPGDDCFNARMLNWPHDLNIPETPDGICFMPEGTCFIQKIEQHYMSFGRCGD